MGQIDLALRTSLGMFKRVMLLIAFCLRAVMGDVQDFVFRRSTTYSDVLPTSDLDVREGLFSRIECAHFCVREDSCQTLFYKSSEKKCSLYKYPMLDKTPVSPEPGVEVFEMKGCSNPVFVLFRKYGVCLKIFTATNQTFSYASTVCEQKASELIILNTTQKIDALAIYLFYTLGAGEKTTIGLRKSSSWQWTNGEPLTFFHPQLINRINNHDGTVHPCTFSYCGIFRIVSWAEFLIFDNCCNNVATSFACFAGALF